MLLTHGFCVPSFGRSSPLGAEPSLRRACRAALALPFCVVDLDKWHGAECVTCGVEQFTARFTAHKITVCLCSCLRMLFAQQSVYLKRQALLVYCASRRLYHEHRGTIVPHGDGTTRSLRHNYASRRLYHASIEAQKCLTATEQ